MSVLPNTAVYKEILEGLCPGRGAAGWARVLLVYGYRVTQRATSSATTEQEEEHHFGTPRAIISLKGILFLVPLNQVAHICKKANTAVRLWRIIYTCLVQSRKLWWVLKVRIRMESFTSPSSQSSALSLTGNKIKSYIKLRLCTCFAS